MIKSFKIMNYMGDTIELILTKPELSGIVVKSVRGLGPVKANINTTEMATADGSYYNSARLNQRNIVFDLLFYEYLQESIETIRQKTYRYFPLKHMLDISVETDNRTVLTRGYVESNEPNIFSQKEGCQISIVCPNPFFHLPGDKSTSIGGVIPLFEFPWSNESLTEDLIVFGEIRELIQGSILYEGDADTGITIYIQATGSAGDITIWDLNTLESMVIDMTRFAAITGGPLQNRDQIILCTVTGNKSMTLLRDGSYYNILNALDHDSNWLKLGVGMNRFAFNAETGLDHLRFRIENSVLINGV